MTFREVDRALGDMRASAKRFDAVERLHAIAKLFDGAAARAFTVLDHEQRQQDARTLRVVAGMVADRRTDSTELVELWVESAERMLAYYDAADMAVVYGERSRRRRRGAIEVGEAGA